MGAQADIRLTESATTRVEDAFAALSSAALPPDHAQDELFYAKRIAKEVAMAERVAFELRRRAVDTPQAIDVPDLEEMFDAMEVRLAQRIDDHVGRIQSLARHNVYAMNLIAEQTRSRLNLVMAICVLQTFAYLAFALWR